MAEMRNEAKPQTVAKDPNMSIIAKKSEKRKREQVKTICEHFAGSMMEENLWL